MVQYPEFIAQGRQIGSRRTEASWLTCTRRLKVGGGRWYMVNAERVAAIANVRDSHQWHPAWPNLAHTAT